MEKTIPEKFFEAAGEFPRKTALIYKKNDVYFYLTFQDFSQRVQKFASGLQKIGVKKGDRVAILSENRPEWAVADLAAMSAGAVVVPVHTTLNPKVVQYILNHSEAKILIVSTTDLLFKVLLSQAELRHLEKIIFLEKKSFGLNEFLEEDILLWEQFMVENGNSSFEPVPLSPDDVCSIIYTSGTTGLPKGVELTHKNFLTNVRAVNKAIPVKKNDVFLSFLPLSHIFERLAGYYVPLFSGASIAYAEGAKQLPQNLREVKPTILIAVPRLFEKFHDAIWDKVNGSSRAEKKLFMWSLKRKTKSVSHIIADVLVFRKVRRRFGGRLRLTISGGATLNKKLAKFFLRTGILVLEGYGLTETSPVVSVNREQDFWFGTVGKPIEDVEIRIASDKEILVKGPNIMKGYFRDRAAFERAVDAQGWFHTGDLGFIDHKGFLTVIGRRKEIIITAGGKNVPPEALESEINDDRFVSQSMVVGQNRRFISALIVPDWQEVKMFLREAKIPIGTPEKLVKIPEILGVFQERIDKINKRLSRYERIAKFKLIVDEFTQERDELTPKNSLRRHIIEKRYQKEIESMYI